MMMMTYSTGGGEPSLVSSSSMMSSRGRERERTPRSDTNSVPSTSSSTSSDGERLQMTMPLHSRKLKVDDDDILVVKPDDGTNNKKNKNIKKCVSFDRVETREFERILGDNPGCSMIGPSLSLGWNYTEKKPMDLNKPKKVVSLKRMKRSLSPIRNFVNGQGYVKDNRQATMMLSPIKREKIALEFGYSLDDIASNMQEVMVAQKLRMQTVKEVAEQENMEYWRQKMASWRERKTRTTTLK